ncbi:MAG TPA: NADH-quinone oxidoreductase subunit NuoB [Bacteroidota bacterium]|nr:NADH-quinone oxidoreductase subunit NuoB [Bacteroidota bacterium]
MLRILKQAIIGGPLTNRFSRTVDEPPPGFRGKPIIDFPSCTACDTCADACPTGAIQVGMSGQNADERVVSMDYGNCIFCGECERVCPTSVRLSKEFQLAVSDKRDLVTRARFVREDDGSYRYENVITQNVSDKQSLEEIGSAVKETVDRYFGRSLHIREVDAGSCNGCEVEITSLSNPVYDIERFGVHFVASPRHADMLLVTGPVTRNMEIALRQTYDATPAPKLVVAVGACAIGGGVFGKSYASCGGVDAVIPVDVYVPGCPPRPEALLHGILAAMKLRVGREK